MKKLIIPALFIALCSCNNASTNKTNATTTGSDTTIHPTGVNEGAVISTDTAAYKVNDSAKQKRSTKQ